MITPAFPKIFTLYANWIPKIDDDGSMIAGKIDQIQWFETVPKNI